MKKSSTARSIIYTCSTILFSACTVSSVAAKAGTSSSDLVLQEDLLDEADKEEDYLSYALQNRIFLTPDLDNTDQKTQMLTDLMHFTTAYPDISFHGVYDSELDDWLITASKTDSEDFMEFYWCQGRMLPQEELKNKEKYASLLYEYSQELLDPLSLTQEQQAEFRKLSEESSKSNRPGTPMFFYDWLYGTYTEAKAYRQMVFTYFLGNPIRIHSRIKAPLEQVEKRIQEAAKTDKATADFVKNISSTEAYYWRIIAGTNRRSFHSLGIAIDFVPKYYGGEAYWSWAQDHRGAEWMFTPLERRWMPPEKIVEAFEAEGFVWGGKWIIWDNMHFEYHPEITSYNGI